MVGRAAMTMARQFIIRFAPGDAAVQIAHLADGRSEVQVTARPGGDGAQDQQGHTTQQGAGDGLPATLPQDEDAEQQGVLRLE